MRHASMHTHKRTAQPSHTHMHVVQWIYAMYVASNVYIYSASQVRALDATPRESDSAKGWNPLYSLAGRHVSQYGR